MIRWTRVYEYNGQLYTTKSLCSLFDVPVYAINKAEEEGNIRGIPIKLIGVAKGKNEYRIYDRGKLVFEGTEEDCAIKYDCSTNLIGLRARTETLLKEKYNVVHTGRSFYIRGKKVDFCEL